MPNMIPQGLWFASEMMGTHPTPRVDGAYEGMSGARGPGQTPTRRP
jgi:hypothetical protein